MKKRPPSYLARALCAGALLAAGLTVGCAGPDNKLPTLAIEIAGERASFVAAEGPRRVNAEAELQLQARRMARKLFRGSPMPDAVRAEGLVAASGQAPVDVEALGEQRPAWADGVPEPPPALEHDLPKAWPVEVRRGETPALLARWAGTDARTLLSDNAETLGRRRWLKTGDRLVVTMSANQKVAFDKTREDFQQERLDAYFAKRYFERVVIYRVKRGEYVSNAAKRYGDVPLWLLEEFNQIDFRTLQPGDEILIPVVATFEPGQKTPPTMRVVDEQGRPVTDEARDRLAARLHPQIVGRARMALDDSNVFERGNGAFSAASRSLLPDYHGVRTAPAAGQPVGPRPAALLPRDIIVKPGETLMHYVEWAGVSMDAIRKANPNLAPDRIRVGSRVGLPLTDQQYVDFFKGRAAWSRKGGDAKPAAAADAAKTPSGRVHVIRKGDTATAIARKYGTSLQALRGANAGANLDVIRVGQRLRLP